MENNESFKMTYSATQQEEIRAIRKKYAAPEADKMEQLRQLDQGVTQKATAVALALGVPGALIMGLGMSLCMSQLGAALGSLGMVLGIVLGLVGIGMACLAYPIYNRTIKKERKRIAPQILRLTEELLN